MQEGPPGHWQDTVHEEDGGCDDRGTRPQHGIDILKCELDALTFKNGNAMAKDDVTGTELVPGLVRKARDEEIAYFIKRGVYEIVPRSHQKTTGGKVIGTRWVDVNKGPAGGGSPNGQSDTKRDCYLLEVYWQAPKMPQPWQSTTSASRHQKPTGGTNRAPGCGDKS